MTGKAHASKIKIELATLIKLRGLYGEEGWWKSYFGFGFDCLKESEPQHRIRVVTAENADAVRNRILEAAQEAVG